MKHKIKNFIQDNNLILGICDAEKLSYSEEKLSKKDVPFVNFKIEERIDPKLTLPSAKTIMVIGMGYNKEDMFEIDDRLRGNISVGAVGSDYHVQLKYYLNEIIKILKDIEGFEYKHFVDTGPLIERELAKKAGLGWEGKNGNIISDIFGSFFFIGYIITNLELTLSTPYENDYNMCGNCTRCIKACPANILKDKENINYYNCVSYITQCKGKLGDKQSQLIGNSIYGCDICQLVCPHNRNTYFDTIEKIEARKPDIEKFLSLSKSEFEYTYGDTAMAWRGMNTLKRNAIIALGNSKDKRGIRILENYLNSDSEVIRYTANKAYNNLITYFNIKSK